MIPAIGLALVAAFVALMLTAAALVGFEDGRELISLASAMPIWILGLGQASFVYRGAWRDSKNVPGFGVLLALVPFAMFAESGFSAHEAGFLLALMVGALLVLAAFGFAGAVILYLLPTVAWVAAWGLTILAFLLATVVPSIPWASRFWVEHPPASYVSSLPVRGVLVADGPPVRLRGVAYRLKRKEYGGGMCDLVMSGEDLASEPYPISYACGPREIRCDDARHWCLVAESERFATGFTYLGEPVTLVTAASSTESTDVLIRICAEVLALVAGLLLWRRRDDEDAAARHVASASAIVAAALGAGLVVRILR